MRVYLENTEGFTRTLFEGDKDEVKAFLKGVSAVKETLGQLTNKKPNEIYHAGLIAASQYIKSEGMLKGALFAAEQLELLNQGYDLKVGE